MSPLPKGRYDLRTDFADRSRLRDHFGRSSKPSLGRVAYAGSIEDRNKGCPTSLTLPDAKKQATAQSNCFRRAGNYAANWNGGLRIFNGTMDDLAYELATGLENPVVNEHRH